MGDKGFKVIIRDGSELEVLVDHNLEYASTAAPRPPSAQLPSARAALARVERRLHPRRRYELSIGNCIESCRWDESGNSLVVTATDGYLWCFDFSNIGR